MDLTRIASLPPAAQVREIKTAAFLRRGLVQRGFDRAFGEAVKSAAREASASTFERRYTRGPKAGTTEIVRRPV